MELKLSFNSIIILFGIMHGFFWIFMVLKFKEGNSFANKILVILILCYILFINTAALYYSNLYYYFPHLIKVGLPCALFIGQLLYLYLKSMILNKTKLSKKDFIHFIPIVVVLLIYLPFYLKSGDYKVMYMTKWLNNTIEDKYRYIEIIITGSMQVVLWAYLIKSRCLISNFLKNNKDEVFSNTMFNLEWDLYLSNALIVFFILILIANVFTYIGFKLKYCYNIIPIIETFLVYFLVYKGILNSKQFIKMKEENNSKYMRSGLSRLRSSEYYRKLISLMNKEKIYTDPDLTLNDLAIKLNISRNHLSQIVNNNSGKNFYDFISYYRVEEAKKIIKKSNEKNKNIIAIAFDVGFNSKSTFNRKFKKYTKMSPVDYKRLCV